MIATAGSSAQSLAPRSSYWEALDRRILAAVREPGATLTSVCERAGGAFPSLVSERLASHGIGLPEETGKPEAALPGAELHAAEFEWYFTPECARELAGLVGRSHGITLLLGAPSVAAAMAEAGGRALSIDRSRFLRGRFEGRVGDLRQADLRRPLGMLRSASAVFFDAPWHEDHITRWLWQASVAVRRGGCIAFALFGPTTRPAAEGERSRLLTAAEAIGRVTLHENALRYRTPLFEAEALRVAGQVIRGSWRRGDLVLVENAQRALRPPPVPRERPWETHCVGDRVLKLRPGLAPAEVDGRHLQTLGTVSRRRIAQVPIAAWDSRNGILLTKAREGR